MKKRKIGCILSILFIFVFLHIFSFAFAQDTQSPVPEPALSLNSPTPTDAPISQDTSPFPTSGGGDTPTSIPTGQVTNAPTPLPTAILTPTTIPQQAQNTSQDNSQTTNTSQKSSKPQPVTPTPITHPTSTSKQKKVKVILPIKIKNNIPPKISNPQVVFPATQLTYQMADDPYVSEALTINVTLELLAIGFAFLVLGTFVLQWREGDVVAKDIQNFSVALRSWLL